MSELDVLKSNINQLNAHCHNMIQSGHIGSNVSDTIDKLVKSSLDIIAEIGKEKVIPPPPKVKEPIELPKTEPSPRKRVKKYGRSTL